MRLYYHNSDINEYLGDCWQRHYHFCRHTELGPGGNKIMLNKAPSQWWQIESDWSDAKKLHLNAETTGQNSDDGSLNALSFLVLPSTDAPLEAIHDPCSGELKYEQLIYNHKYYDLMMLNAVSKEARIILLKQSSNNYLALEEVCGTTIAFTASLCVFLGYRLAGKS